MPTHQISVQSERERKSKTAGMDAGKNGPDSVEHPADEGQVPHAGPMYIDRQTTPPHDEDGVSTNVPASDTPGKKSSPDLSVGRATAVRGVSVETDSSARSDVELLAKLPVSHEAWGEHREERASPHVEAKTVIIGDTNSDALSDDTSQATDCVGALAPGGDVQGTGQNIALAEKRSSGKSSNKTGKKDKPIPMRKKDSETQV